MSYVPGGMAYSRNSPDDELLVRKNSPPLASTRVTSTFSIPIVVNLSVNVPRIQPRSDSPSAKLQNPQITIRATVIKLNRLTPSIPKALKARISHEFNGFNGLNSLNSFNPWLIPQLIIPLIYAKCAVP